MGMKIVPNIIAGKISCPDGIRGSEVVTESTGSGFGIGLGSTSGSGGSTERRAYIESIDGSETAFLAAVSASEMRSALRYGAEQQPLLDKIPLKERLEVARLVLREYAAKRDEVARDLARYRGLPAKDTFWMSDVLVDWTSHLDELVDLIYGGISSPSADGRYVDHNDFLTWKSKGTAGFFLSSTMDGPSAVTALCHAIITGTHMIVRPSWRDVVTHHAFEVLVSHKLGHFGQLLRWSSADVHSEALNRQFLLGVRQAVIFSSNETYADLLRQAAPEGSLAWSELSQRTKRYGTGLPLGIVMPGADLEKAAQELVEGARLGGGRFCLSAGPVLVHQDCAKQLAGLIVEAAQALCIGPAEDGGTDLASHATSEYRGLISGAEGLGGKKLFGSIRDRDMDMLVLADLPEQSACLYQEFPGTLLALSTVASLDEAVSRAGQALKKNGRLAWTAVTVFGSDSDFNRVQASVESFRYLFGGVAARVKLLLPHQGSYFGSDLIRRISIERSI